MKTREQIEAKLEKVLADKRLSYVPATIQINAPLAIVQTVLETERDVLKWVLEDDPVLEYNPQFGDDKICRCGHEYHRHFDSYDNMNPIGCKYCDCRTFKS